MFVKPRHPRASCLSNPLAARSSHAPKTGPLTHTLWVPAATKTRGRLRTSLDVNKQKEVPRHARSSHAPKTDGSSHAPKTDGSSHAPNTDRSSYAPNTDRSSHAPNTCPLTLAHQGTQIVYKSTHTYTHVYRIYIHAYMDTFVCT